jgi:hypothetical protein
MKYRSRIYYTEQQKALMWERWQKGDSLQKIAQIGFLRGRSSVHFSHSHGYRLCRVRYGKLYGGAMDFPCTIGNWPRWPESKILSDVASDFLSFFKYTLSHASLFNYCSDPPRHPLRARHIVLPRAFC